MSGSFARMRRAKDTADEATPVKYDDGGSGILEACKRKFAPLGCTVTCDASHTVWVKHPDGTKSVGLQPWLVSRYTPDELLAKVEAKLGLKAVAR